jgi:hypothetical protein
MDASTKMDNTIMESIEPFDYTQMVDFETAYLSGYLADKYDVEHTLGEERIRQRVSTTLDDQIHASMIGYATTILFKSSCMSSTARRNMFCCRYGCCTADTRTKLMCLP